MESSRGNSLYGQASSCLVSVDHCHQNTLANTTMKLVGIIFLKLLTPMGGTILYCFVWKNGTLTHVQVTLLLCIHVDSHSYENTNCHFWVS